MDYVFYGSGWSDVGPRVDTRGLCGDDAMVGVNWRTGWGWESGSPAPAVDEWNVVRVSEVVGLDPRVRGDDKMVVFYMVVGMICFGIGDGS
ncbi:MAG: hypothetical protein GY869_21305 [Planctomycetes bacterium]|nr:hypothetical protein [Planctomycetota bacterium]